MVSLSSASSSSSIQISPDRLKSLDKPRRRLHGPNSTGLKQKSNTKKIKKDKLRKNLKNGSNASIKATKDKSSERGKTNSYINSSDRPYFIFFLYILTSLFLGINALYQYKVSKTGIFHEELNIFNISKYIFCSFMPILLIAVWVSTVLTKMRFLLSKMVMFFLKNLKFFMKPEVILFLIVSFISYRVLLFIPIIFKYIHSISDFIPYGGPIVSFALLIVFIFMMFFLIVWMIMIFSYDVSDSIFKFISNTTSYIFGKSFSRLSRKKSNDDEEIVDNFDD
ncbi:hypothetical protein H8356DRAFT_1427126 [Neocallimastix lanati (nom. inval.)]|jgi:magnesium-transporting ATPase (P-type)|uniref:Uncharacterized protein n=1 Tax=Neocallimastix californiae TaxID=1754190 RepID=A0A1Y2BBY4_9FUNG|nr:hypothetical protein H8356DRAFT_1427126 [Neocallimastix sp. JGI-2020a]ORY32342.1 hypothetical protein LY90DRAFT_673522 [Neocallimastix californiae]|eukprot:ORY32342.1 hypothetical protein LY90DRAFT_673522 [Neocallimastix californiae]